ncbi:MAG: MBL fold metallo-hydrolase, partial [Bacteroidota bacterium]
MKVEQIYTGCLAQGAYYIESEGEAVIIDPLRETQPYLDKLAKEGARLKYIFETHFHADFVSGHIDLARETGATIVYGPMAETEYKIKNATDGEIISVGKIQFKVLHTPGHTMESTTYLLRDESGKDHAIFTGDTLFLGDVGRPDLAIKQGKITKEDLAGFLFDSLRSKIMPLADDVIVYPAHGAGSACGKNLSSDNWSFSDRQGIP